MEKRLLSESKRRLRASKASSHEVTGSHDHFSDFGRHRRYSDRSISIHPSYTNFKIPYHIMCQVRYVRVRAQMEVQFQKEFRQLLGSMESAYETARFMRHLGITTFWPPLHNRKEIMVTQNFFQLSQKQKERLYYLMSTNII